MGAMRILGSIALVLVAAAWAAPASAEIAISRKDCSRLVNHEPAPDVTYQPGVDVHGRPVAPADLGGGQQIQLPDVIYIPIEVLTQDSFNIPPQFGAVQRNRLYRRGLGARKQGLFRGPAPGRPGDRRPGTGLPGPGFQLAYP